MILVAGGTGFVGSAITWELAHRGHRVAVMSRNPSAAANRFPGLDVTFREGDVTDPGSLGPALDGAEAVVGCQQFPNSPIENPGKGFTFENVDAAGTEHLVAAAKAAGARRFVYLSGAGAAPEGRHWFRAKWRAETAVRNGGITYTILRPSWVYGSEDNALNRFVRMARFLPFVPQIGAIDRQRMQPVFVEDVARAVAGCLESDAAANRVFELGGPEVISMKQVVSTALEVSGRKRPILAAPAGLMKLLAGILQFAPGRPLTPDAVDFITSDAVADPAELQQAIGFKPTPLREGLETYLGRQR
ncbi:MAG: NAD(P)H-binding protein [Dehalococcoidia bacterium]